MSLPGRLWIQATRRFWLGPIAAVRFHNPPPPPAPGRDDAQILLGAGFGYSFGRFADLKADFLFPNVGGAAPGQNFGIGVGLGLTFD